MGDPVGLAVPQPSRIVTPLTGGEPAVNVSKVPNGVRRSRSKKLPSPRGIRTSFVVPVPKYGVIVYVLPGVPTTFCDASSQPSSPSCDPWLWRGALLPIVENGSA